MAREEARREHAGFLRVRAVARLPLPLPGTAPPQPAPPRGPEPREPGTEGGVAGALCACAALTGGRWKPRWGGRAGCRRRAGAVLGGRAASGVRVRRDEAGGSSAAAAR